eukprot:CAMPEP_0173199464 /NCGR_PEP_ID=MMETSP1141-20130122/17251_1 /TAXON_ID=483371 /ORGANISM="non described non described, Strain CCMP2298" /LENGTH=48 /DNA_ID= /DNA_START= /DNA_END= /DNA_ORIENTATION=
MRTTRCRSTAAEVRGSSGGDWASASASASASACVCASMPVSVSASAYV